MKNHETTKKQYMAAILIAVAFLFTAVIPALAEEAASSSSQAGVASPMAQKGAEFKAKMMQRRHDKLQKKLERMQARREKLVTAKAPQEKIDGLDKRIQSTQTRIQKLESTMQKQ